MGHSLDTCNVMQIKCCSDSNWERVQVFMFERIIDLRHKVALNYFKTGIVQ